MKEEGAVRDFTLMLMYLTSWRERGFDRRRCWKGYDFAVVDELEEAGLISSSHRAKSAYVTEEGETRALEFLKSFGVGIEDAT